MSDISDNMFKFFEKYKGDCNVFFETGTHLGDTIQRAVALGYDKVISVELNFDRYNHCCNRFKNEIDQGKVILFGGETTKRFDEMMSLLSAEDRCFFWLDAHDEGGGAPAREELAIIKKYNRKCDRILVDDMNLYYQDNIDQMRDSLKEINGAYEISFDNFNNLPGVESILIAMEKC